MGYNTKPKYGFWNFVLDLFLIIITGGIWLIWMIFKALRSR